MEKSDRLRARKLLTRRRNTRPPTCSCFTTLRARNEIELRDWIDEFQESGIQPDPDDSYLAVLVRRLVQGERLEPWAQYRRTTEAVQDVIAERLNRAETQTEAADERATGENDLAVEPFWRAILSADPSVTVKERLQAFDVLDELKVFPECSCKPAESLRLIETQVDEQCA